MEQEDKVNQNHPGKHSVLGPRPQHPLPLLVVLSLQRSQSESVEVLVVKQTDSGCVLTLVVVLVL